MEYVCCVVLLYRWEGAIASYWKAAIATLGNGLLSLWKYGAATGNTAVLRYCWIVSVGLFVLTVCGWAERGIPYRAGEPVFV